MQNTALSLYYCVNLWHSQSSASFWSGATLVMERLVWTPFKKPLPQRKYICKEDHNYSKNWILIVKSWPYWSQSIFSIDFIVPRVLLESQGTEVSPSNSISLPIYPLCEQKVTVLKEFKTKSIIQQPRLWLHQTPTSIYWANKLGEFLGKERALWQWKEHLLTPSQISHFINITRDHLSWTLTPLTGTDWRIKKERDTEKAKWCRHETNRLQRR